MRADGVTATACVLGSVDLLQALRLAGLPVAVFTGRTDPLRWSRHVSEVHDAPSDFCDQSGFARRLQQWSARQPEQPVLYPQSDSDLLMLLAHRTELEACFRLALADTALLRDLVDKTRFAALAERVGLPVPRSVVLRPGQEAVDVPFPVLAKPRDKRGMPGLGTGGKALRLETPDDLVRAAGRLTADGDVLIQELVPGEERQVESYHAYVDGRGQVTGEFTGAKLRTWPCAYGTSSALVTTCAGDVLAAGRDLVERIGLRGVLKADFKRGPDGRLWLLEVNPRFSLWNSLGALGGVNLPALVHADLTGSPRPPTKPVPAGLTWCHPLRDLLAAHSEGITAAAWLRFLRGCDLLSGVEGRDPRPLLFGMLLPGLQRRLVPSASQVG